jgi:uncharacterized RDD family membrane protein YckC
MDADEPIGDATKSRIYAFVIDNFLAIAAAVAVLAALKTESPVVGGVTVCLVYLSYYFVFEALWSKTPGKLFNRLEVRRLDGRPCGVKESLIRTLARIIEANPVLFGGLPAGIIVMSSEQRQRLGDMLAGTAVIKRDS